MKQSQMYSLCLIASLGFAAPVSAQQGMMDGRDGMMGGMMSGMNSYAMRTFDANEDGILTPEEMTAGMQAEIKTYDTDTSGSLSLVEFEAMHAAHTRTMMVRAFQMHDEDGDGQVTEAEMATMAAMMQPASGPKGAVHSDMTDGN
ncbi:calcium-binding protein [Cypionkella sp.]|uniref:calcium-binding protein n=1 Tax=Cypionkella sp. TaxID=2811411 RepID=UPI002ABD1302|nr:calcium-binding protein [Cypionkella sp.]MDZ4391525.1 calcium-binding protein [Cypionkella sp.]